VRAVPALARTLMPYGCERTPGTLRVLLPRIYQTENGRGVVYPSGDFLPNWPPGFTGKGWRAWRARCIVELRAVGIGVAAIDCDVSPASSPDEVYAGRDSENRWPAATDYRDGDSVRVTVFVTTTDAFLTDTLRTVARSLPRLDDHSIRDANPPCGGWSAHSSQSGELYVVKGDPAGNSLYITPVSTRAPPVSRGAPMRCGPQEPRISDFTAFLLGGVGDMATEPITLCFSRCARSYVLDPARHTRGERAHIVFRVGDLRRDTRLGEYFMFRLVLDPAPPGLLPLVLVRSGNRWPTSGWSAKRTGPNTWDYMVIQSYAADDEVHVYLIVR
jgi:hypothetical protein